MGVSDTEITVSENVGTVQVGLQVFNPPSVSDEFANTLGITGFGSNVFAVAGSATGKVHCSCLSLFRVHNPCNTI